MLDEERYSRRFSGLEMFDEDGNELEEISVVRRTSYDDIYPLGIYNGRKRVKNVRQMNDD